MEVEMPKQGGTKDSVDKKNGAEKELTSNFDILTQIQDSLTDPFCVQEPSIRNLSSSLIILLYKV